METRCENSVRRNGKEWFFQLIWDIGARVWETTRIQHHTAENGDRSALHVSESADVTILYILQATYAIIFDISCLTR